MKTITKFIICFIIGFALVLGYKARGASFELNDVSRFELRQTVKARVAYSAYMERTDYPMTCKLTKCDRNVYEALGRDYAGACLRLTGSYGNYLCRIAVRNRIGF